MNQQQPYYPQQPPAPPPPQGWQQQPPPGWPPPPKQKLSLGKKLLIGFAALIVVSAIIGQNDTESSTPSPAAVDTASDDVALDDISVDDFEVDPADVVDIMLAGDSTLEETFCMGADLLGYQAGLAEFKSGYGNAQNPSAAEVYDEFLSRC